MRESIYTCTRLTTTWTSLSQFLTELKYQASAPEALKAYTQAFYLQFYYAIIFQTKSSGGNFHLKYATCLVPNVFSTNMDFFNIMTGTCYQATNYCSSIGWFMVWFLNVNNDSALREHVVCTCFKRFVPLRYILWGTFSYFTVLYLMSFWNYTCHALCTFKLLGFHVKV